MADEGQTIKYGLQISTTPNKSIPEGTGALMTVVSEEEGVVQVHTKAEGFEASQDGAEAIRDLFRDMADAIDRELGNTPPDGQTRRGSADRCEVCGEPSDGPDYVHIKCLGKVKRYPRLKDNTAAMGPTPVSKKPLFNPQPREKVRGRDNITQAGERPPMGLAAQRERRARKDKK